MLDNASRVDSTYTYMLLQAREIALTNPTRHALSYTVRLEGDGDSFVLDASVIKIEPGTSVQVCAVCDGQICCGTLVDHTFQGGVRRHSLLPKRGVHSCWKKRVSVLGLVHSSTAYSVQHLACFVLYRLIFRSQ
jgi:hypothetical protein